MAVDQHQVAHARRPRPPSDLAGGGVDTGQESAGEAVEVSLVGHRRREVGLVAQRAGTPGLLDGVTLAVLVDVEEGRLASVDQEDPAFAHRHGLSRRKAPTVTFGVLVLPQHLTVLGSQAEQAPVGDRHQHGLALQIECHR